MDTLGIEPNTSRMLSERDNQLHHVPPVVGVCSATLECAIRKDSYTCLQLTNFLQDVTH